MSEDATNSGRRRIWVAATAGVTLLAVFLVAAWYLRSSYFKAWVRGRVMADVRDITGGQVELKSLDWNLSKLEFNLRDLTIHGREAPGQVPYAHVDRVMVQAKILSLFRREIGLRYLEIERPVIHLIVYPDGTTNQPAPAVKQSAANSVQRLFDLAVDRAEVRNGGLLVNNRPFPLDFAADGLKIVMSYDPAGKRYDGNVHVSRIDAQYRDFLPLASMVDATFSLWPTKAELKSLRLLSGRSMLDVSGNLNDFRNPILQLAYSARVHLAEFGAAARIPQLRGGTLELNGQGTYPAPGVRGPGAHTSDFASTGKLAIRELDYRDPSVRVANASLGAQYSASRERLSLSHLFAHVFGGTVTGEADVRNWMTAVSMPPNQAEGSAASRRLQEGTAKLDVRNMPIASVAAAVSSRAMPLDHINLVGNASGTVKLDWKGTPADLHAAVLLQVVPAPNPAPGQLPVSASIDAEYSRARETLNVADLRLSTRATRLTASGRLGPRSGNLNLQVTTTDLGEFQPVLDAFHGPKQLPVELRGRATFVGTVSGRISSPSIQGHLQAADFSTDLAALASAGALPATAVSEQRTLARHAHWDLLSADIVYSPSLASAHNGLLRSGEAQLRFDFALQLERGRFLPANTMKASLAARNVGVGDLGALAGYNYPVTGTLNADLTLSGSRSDPRGSGHLALSGGSAYGEFIDSLTADVFFANHEAQANQIVLARNGARVTGTAAYNLNTTALRFDVRGSNFNLARLRRLQTPRLAIGGEMNFVARGSGPRDAPSITASLQLTDLTLNGEKAGNLTAEAVTTGADMRISARSSVENADLRVDGTVHLRDDCPANLTVNFSRIDFDALIRAFLKARTTGHSSMAGSVQVRGPLSRPRDLELVGAIEQLSAEIESIHIQNDGPIRFKLAQQVFHLEQLRLSGEDTNISASGTAQLTGQRRLDLRADGRANLRLVQSFNPDLISYGMGTFGLNVGGVISNPSIQGQVQIANAGISHTALPNGLSDVNGTLVFNQDRVQVQSLTARTGGGMLDIGGFVTYGRTFTFNLTASGRDVRLRYPPGISAVANTDLRLTGSLQNSTLTGDVTIKKFGVTPQFDFASYVARAKQPPEIPNPNSPLNNVHLDVHIVSTPELQVQTSLAKLSGDVDLRLRGVGTKPTVLGKVNIVEGDVLLQRHQVPHGTGRHHLYQPGAD